MVVLRVCSAMFRADRVACHGQVIAQPAKIEACDVHNHHYVEDEYAVTETRLRLHDDASLLPTESKVRPKHATCQDKRRPRAAEFEREMRWF